MVSIRISVVSVVGISKVAVMVSGISLGFGHSSGGEQAQGNDSNVLHHYCDLFASL